MSNTNVNTVDLSKAPTSTIATGSAGLAQHPSSTSSNPAYTGYGQGIYGGLTRPSGTNTFQQPVSYSISNGVANQGLNGMISSSNAPSILNPTGTIQLRGEKADILFNEKSLRKILEGIEERLNLLVPNEKLEEEWEELSELGKKYRELEKSIIEKKKTWDRLAADYSKNR
jgi:hypothetical protein